MLAKTVLVWVLFQTVFCQEPEGNKKIKSRQWKNFLRDWHILMKHIFTAQEEEILLKCCTPNQSKALNSCLGKAGLTFEQFKELKSAIERWRSGDRDKNGRSSPEEERDELSAVTDASKSVSDLMERARNLSKCIAEIE